MQVELAALVDPLELPRRRSLVLNPFSVLAFWFWEQWPELPVLALRLEEKSL